MTIFEFTKDDIGLETYITEAKDTIVPSCLKYIHAIGKFTVKVEQQRGEAVEDI